MPATKAGTLRIINTRQLVRPARRSWTVRFTSSLMFDSSLDRRGRQCDPPEAEAVELADAVLEGELPSFYGVMLDARERDDLDEPFARDGEGLAGVAELLARPPGDVVADDLDSAGALGRLRHQ